MDALSGPEPQDVGSPLHPRFDYPVLTPLRLHDNKALGGSDSLA